MAHGTQKTGEIDRSNYLNVLTQGPRSNFWILRLLAEGAGATTVGKFWNLKKINVAV